MAVPPVADPPLDPQLRHYETHSRVYAQVTDLYTSVVSTTNLYVIVTGGFWAAIAPNLIQLTPTLRALGLGAHILLSLALWIILGGLAATLRQRLNFLNALGERYWPAIEALGVAARQVEGRWTIRHQSRVWPFAPVVGGAVSFVMILVILSDARSVDAGCATRIDRLMTANSAVELDRAKYLLDKSGCDLRRVAIEPIAVPAPSPPDP